MLSKPPGFYTTILGVDFNSASVNLPVLSRLIVAPYTVP